MPAIVTLLTDFGWRDPYVAEMKAVLLNAVDALTIIDVSHDVEPGNVAMGAYILNRVWSWFPSGTVHLAVVDPGVGTRRRAIAAQSGGHSFVGPDNGLFGSILTNGKAVVLDVPPNAAPTFHGRDVFAPAAGRLLQGNALSELGPFVNDLAVPSGPNRRREGDRVIGRVAYVDRFGNLITDLPANEVRAVTTYSVAGITVGMLRRTFGDVAPGAFVAYLGSGGTVEVAIRDGSAAAALGAVVGTEVVGVLGPP